MAFASSDPSPFNSNVQTRIGPDLPEISTEGFGFQNIAGQAKLRLLPTPWPADNPPPPTASLLSVASKKGLLAAAGPESVVIASTDVVRRAYTESSGDGDIKTFTPQLSLNLGMRISQVAFSADENFLVLSAQNGGGLAVYEVANLMNGVTQSSFELATNGISLRHLASNPTPEKAEFFALVTETGHVMMANLKSRELLSRGQSPIMREGVSCVSWSNRGKQLVAGLGDGTCIQMTPEGEQKGEIPRPPNLEGDQHVSSILWLENDIFLVAHTPTFPERGTPPATNYTLVTRAKSQMEFLFQNLPEPCFPSGLDRVPTYQFMQRLRDFPPNLTDAILVASTGSEDIGLILRSKTLFSSDQPVDQVKAFTTTSMADDSRRAQMPMNEDFQSTSPIGVALDLSSKETVSRPLPKEEFDESAGPLPALMVLNNEGALITWWLVYADSIRQKTSFPGLAALGGIQPRISPETQRQTSPFASAGQQSEPAPGQATFSQPLTPAFRSTKPSSTFGAPSNLATGSAPTPTLGNQASSWTGASSTAPTTPAFGKPSFGSSTPAGLGTSVPAFGQAGGLARSSLWGTPQTGSAAASGSAFGQTGNLGMRSNAFVGASSAAPFGSTAATTNTLAPTGGFASFAAKTSAFMIAGSAPILSDFGQPSSSAAVTPPAASSSPFDQLSFKNETPKSTFGSTSGFKLESTFKSDGTASNDAPKPTGTTGSSMFDTSFGDVLGKAGTEEIQTKDADMEDDADAKPEEKSQEQSSQVEASRPPESPKPTTPPKDGGLFGTQSQSKGTPAEVGSSKPAALDTLEKVKPDAIAPREIHVKGKDLSTPQMSPKVKNEPESSEDERPLTEAPLPPESTSKTSFAPGDSSNSSKSSNEEPAEPPFPPDPFPTKSKLSNVESVSTEPPLPPDPPVRAREVSKEEPAPVEAPELPNENEDQDQDGDGEGEEEEEDGEGADDESSGVDVAQELTSPSEHTQSPKISPDNSMTSNKSITEDLFSKGPNPKLVCKVPALFGEVDETSAVFGKPSVPYFPPNKSQQGLRSPSPVRQSQISMDSLRPDNARSISAPGPSIAVANRKAALSQVAVPSRQTQLSGVELRQQKEQRLAAEQAKLAAEEEQSLSDEEDELIRRELGTPVPGSRFLDPFLAHQDYVGRIDKFGVPGQIEKVYRDINSMIDTLGLNARSLTAFVKGHSEQIDDGEISADDLDHLDDFALDEVPKLVALESQLSEDLDNHRVQDTYQILSFCRDLRKDIQSLRHKHNDLANAIESAKDPELIESALSAPLSLEQASQQHDIRKKFAHFQKLLAQAEGDITLLRAKLAASDKVGTSRPGSLAGGLPVQKKPTVEAVTKTILKMTSMIEKKSGDIDVLKAQLRSLRSPSVENGQSSSREGSPFSSSKPGKANNANRSPLKSLQNSSAAASSLGSSPLRRSLNGDTSTPKGSNGLLEDEEAQVEHYRLKAKRRKEVNALVRQVYEKAGPRITPLD